MPDTPTELAQRLQELNTLNPRDPPFAMEMAKLLPRLIAALSRLSQVEQERDASDAAIEWLQYMAGKAPWPGCEADDHAPQWVSEAIKRHRSRQKTAGTT